MVATLPIFMFFHHRSFYGQAAVTGGYVLHLQDRTKRFQNLIKTDLRSSFPSLKLNGRKPPRANMLVADHLKPAARRVGVKGYVGFHTFRRTLASHLVANNYDPKLAQELLRHSNIRTALDIYAQAITPKKLEAQGTFLRSLLAQGEATAWVQ